MLKRVTAKLGNMRKEVDWIVYPPSRTENHDKPTLIVQSDKRIASIEIETGKGKLSNGKGHPGFHALSDYLGAMEIDVPMDLVKKFQEAQPNSGDTIGTAGSSVVRIA